MHQYNGFDARNLNFKNRLLSTQYLNAINAFCPDICRMTCFADTGCLSRSLKFDNGFNKMRSTGFYV